MGDTFSIFPIAFVIMGLANGSRVGDHFIISWVIDIKYYKNEVAVSDTI